MQVEGFAKGVTAVVGRSEEPGVSAARWGDLYSMSARRSKTLPISLSISVTLDILYSVLLLQEDNAVNLYFISRTLRHLNFPRRENWLRQNQRCRIRLLWWVLWRGWSIYWGVLWKLWRSFRGPRNGRLCTWGNYNSNWCQGSTSFKTFFSRLIKLEILAPAGDINACEPFIRVSMFSAVPELHWRALRCLPLQRWNTTTRITMMTWRRILRAIQYRQQWRRRRSGHSCWDLHTWTQCEEGTVVGELQAAPAFWPLWWGRWGGGWVGWVISPGVGWSTFSCISPTSSVVGYKRYFSAIKYDFDFGKPVNCLRLAQLNTQYVNVIDYKVMCTERQSGQLTGNISMFNQVTSAT